MNTGNKAHIHVHTSVHINIIYLKAILFVLFLGYQRVKQSNIYMGDIFNIDFLNINYYEILFFSNAFLKHTGINKG